MTEVFIFIIEAGLRREGDSGDEGMRIRSWAFTVKERQQIVLFG